MAFLNVSPQIQPAANVQTPVRSLVKEGWLRPPRKCREASLAGADEVVGSSHRLLLDVERTTPSALSKERGYLLNARPPLLCQGGESSRSNLEQMSKLQRDSLRNSTASPSTPETRLSAAWAAIRFVKCR